jgi:uncharacterized protein YjdB
VSSTPSIATIGSASGIITGIAPGTSTITFTSSVGCIRTVIATVATVPAVAPISGTGSVIIGNTTLATDATPGGVWSSSSAANATVSSVGLITGVAVGAATISYTVANGVCLRSVTKPYTITISRPGYTGIGQDDANLFLVYPNPSYGTFTVQSSVTGVFSVCTLEGKEVLRSSIVEGLNPQELPKGVAAGIYMCRFSGNDGSVIAVRLVYEP